MKTPVTQNVGFTPLRTGGYPNSLLGVFSSLRQMLLDAQDYRDEQAAYARNARGMRRPEADPSLEALVPVVDGRLPVVMQASTQRCECGVAADASFVLAVPTAAYTAPPAL